MLTSEYTNYINSVNREFFTATLYKLLSFQIKYVGVYSWTEMSQENEETSTGTPATNLLLL